MEEKTEETTGLSKTPGEPVGEKEDTPKSKEQQQTMLEFVVCTRETHTQAYESEFMLCTRLRVIFKY